MRIVSVLLSAVIASATGSAFASECRNPNALGTSRVLAVDPVAFPLVGKTQYIETLKLKDREIVLTFDDGPDLGTTDKILEALAIECVKATFFMIGINAAEAPDLAKRVYDEGHTVGFHTFSHPDVESISFEQAKNDINRGMAAVKDALGSKRKAAPFYRPPYLSMTKQIERYLIGQGLMIWSIDVDSDDWQNPTDEILINQTVERLEKAGRGILLLHDIQPVTARILPRLLSELKRRDFKIVHAEPPAYRDPKTVMPSKSNPNAYSWSSVRAQLELDWQSAKGWMVRAYAGGGGIQQ